MLITTVETLQGMQIAEYKGIVSCRVQNAKAKKADLSGTARDTMAAISAELEKQAASCGADVVIGVRVFPESITTFATGTAVRLE